MDAVRNGYSEIGVDNYYIKHKDDYRNPHSLVISEILKSEGLCGNVLDLCCGSGEVTTSLSGCNVVGCDPYTYNLYIKNTDCNCFCYDFKEISQGALRSEGVFFDVIVCSFALHLCPLSLLPLVLYELSCISNRLIILSPHKRPYIKNYWKLNRSYVHKRVHFREYLKNYD